MNEPTLLNNIVFPTCYFVVSLNKDVIRMLDLLSYMLLWNIATCDVGIDKTHIIVNPHGVETNWWKYFY